jgi:hypothetical protein
MLLLLVEPYAAHRCNRIGSNRIESDRIGSAISAQRCQDALRRIDPM